MRIQQLAGEDIGDLHRPNMIANIYAQEKRSTLQLIDEIEANFTISIIKGSTNQISMEVEMPIKEIHVLPTKF